MHEKKQDICREKGGCSYDGGGSFDLRISHARLCR